MFYLKPTFIFLFLLLSLSHSQDIPIFSKVLQVQPSKFVFSGNELTGKKDDSTKEQSRVYNSELNTQTKTFKDDWVAEDKARHLVGSFILVGISSQSLKRFADFGSAKSTNIGFAFSFGIGFAKESYDGLQSNNKFSFKDLTVDLVGTTFGYFVFR